MRSRQSSMNRFPSRRQFLGGAATAAASLSLPGYGCGAGGSRPNILWMIAEDFCPNLGCYGDQDVYSPNIDRLASQGMRFTNAFMTAAVCSAARSALATGMYQTSIGAHNHRSHRGDGYQLPEGVHVFTHYLREAGYHTSNLKDSHGLEGSGKTDFNFNVKKPYDGEDWSERQDGQPFYAQINFHQTHRAFQRCPSHPVDPAKVNLPPYYPDHPAVRLDWAMYLETAENLDISVGKVLDRLEKEGLAENTMVFFFGDHGRPMPRGKQFLYDGGIHIPLIARIPEKFRVQGYAAAKVNNNLASSIDITATTLRLAGIDPPANMEGRPFFGTGVQKREHIIAARDRCDETVDRIRCVRDKKFKYIRNFYPDRAYTQQNVYKDAQYPPLRVMRDLKAAGKLTGPPALFLADKRPPEELYNLELDPDEINNVAEDPDYAKRLEGMRGILDQWVKDTGDKGAIPENKVMERDKDRSKVDGWCTNSGCLLSKAGGVLKVECHGKRAAVLRSVVESGEDMVLQFRARSNTVVPSALGWGTIQHMRNAKNRIKLQCKADGKWHEYLVPFQPGGYLGQLTLDIGNTTGTLEFDWIRLSRKEKGRAHKLQQWDFA